MCIYLQNSSMPSFCKSTYGMQHCAFAPSYILNLSMFSLPHLFHYFTKYTLIPFSIFECRDNKQFEARIVRLEFYKKTFTFSFSKVCMPNKKFHTLQFTWVQCFFKLFLLYILRAVHTLQFNANASFQRLPLLSTVTWT